MNDNDIIGGIIEGEHCVDQKSPSNDHRVFTTEDMRMAFRHGREFELIETSTNCDDICDATPDKQLPFYDWLSRHYGPRQ